MLSLHRLVHPTAPLPRQAEVKVIFNAAEPDEYRKALIIDATDGLAMAGPIQRHTLPLTAEAFEVQVMGAFAEAASSLLDFGTIRVAEVYRHSFHPSDTCSSILGAPQTPSLDYSLANTGKYPSRFEFVVHPRAAPFLTVEPAQGILGVGPKDNKATVQVHFHANREVSMPLDEAGQDLVYRLYENESPEAKVSATVPVPVKVQALYNRFRLSPASGLSFGPCLAAQKRARTFDLINTGPFELRFALLADGSPNPFAPDPQQPATAPGGARREPPKSAGGKKPAAPAPGPAKPAAKGAAAAAAPATLQVGPFTAGPAEGVVPVNGEVHFTVEFNPEGAQLVHEILRLVFQDCSPDDQPPAGLPYDLSGESCIPGIDTAHMDSVFEEQTIVPRLDLFSQTQRNVFAAHEQVFLFGPVLATQPVTQRFRLSNPFRVPAEVACAVRDKAAALLIAAAPSQAGGPPAPFEKTPRAVSAAKPAPKGGAAAAAAGADEAAGESGAVAFDVDQKKLVIPPREHRYVTVTFNPPSMRPYEAVFQALVEQSTSPHTRLVQFDVRGEGILPHVTVVEPRVDATATAGTAVMPSLAFPKLLVGRERTDQIVLRNEGPVTAEVRVDLPESPHFTVALGSGTLAPEGSTGAIRMSLEPQRSGSLQVRYHPTAPGSHQARVRLTTARNDFDETSVQLQGEAYAADVVFEGLPQPPQSYLARMAALAAAAQAASEPVKKGGAAAAAAGAKAGAPAAGGKGPATDPLASASTGGGPSGVDLLCFGDVAVGQTRQLAFTLRNCTEKSYRFAWDPTQPLPATPVADQPDAKSSRGPKVDPAKPAAKPAAGAPAAKAAAAAAAENAGPSLADFVITPRVGHLLPHGTKTFSMTYTSTGPIALNRVPYRCTLTPIIRQTAGGQGLDEEGQLAEWDDGMKSIRWSLEPEAPPPPPPAPVDPEPPFDPVLLPDGTSPAPTTTAEVQLLVTSDYSKCRLSRGRLAFRETMMFQARKASVALVNTGAIALHYVALVCSDGLLPRRPAHPAASAAAPAPAPAKATRPTSASQPPAPTNPAADLSADPALSLPPELACLPDGLLVPEAAAPPTDVGGDADDDERQKATPDQSPFKLAPTSGWVEPGETKEIEVTFAPLEAIAWDRLLSVRVDDMAPGTQGPRCILSGVATRPLCHFELAGSDYLTTRRSDELAGLKPIDPSTRVIEFESRGIRVRNTRRFYILNPTNIGFEYEWECVEPLLTVPTGAPAPASDPSSSTSAKPPATAAAAAAAATAGCPFRCQTRRGVVLPGKKSELTFEYVPETLDTVESLWMFHIREHKRSLPFLLVGQALEPRVSFARTHVNFQARLVGHSTTETVILQNLETVPFAFNFDMADLQAQLDLQRPGAGGEAGGSPAAAAKAVAAAGGQPVVVLSPTAGSVGPESQVAIQVRFTPVSEIAYNFNLSCLVRKKATKLNLNVKGEGYRVHETLTLEPAPELPGAPATAVSSPAAPRGTRAARLAAAPPPPPQTRPVVLRPVESADTATTRPSLLEFGVVQVQETRVRNVTISNAGTYPMDFRWVVGPTEAPQRRAASPSRLNLVRVVPDVGTVPKGERVTCAVSFKPVVTGPMAGYPLLCQITNGPTYAFAASGEGYRPHLEFSFTEHDFGAALLTPPTTTGEPSATAVPVPEAVLTITNSDTREVSYEPLFVGESDGSLRNDAAPTLLAPGQSRSTTFRFTPREVRSYGYKLPFLINGLVTMEVAIRGEGVAARVEATGEALTTTAAPVAGTITGPGGPLLILPAPPGCDPADLDQALCRRVSFGGLRCGQSVTRVFDVINRTRVPMPVDLTPNLAALRAMGITLSGIPLSPDPAPVLSRGQSLQISATFVPQGRQQNFLMPIVAACGGFTKPLCVLAGSCLGLEIKPDVTTVNFGPVAKGNRVTRVVRLDNTGDLVAHVTWDVDAMGSDFSVSPAVTSLRPGAEALNVSDIAKPACLLFPFPELTVSPHPPLPIPYQVELSLHPSRALPDLRLDSLLCFVSSRPHPAGTPFPPPPTRTSPSPSGPDTARPRTKTLLSRAPRQPASTEEPQDMQHIYFTLCGSGIDQAPEGEPLRLSTPVRQEATAEVQITNRSPVPWALHPGVTGDGFSGPAVLEVAPGATAACVVSYRPLRMTPPGKPSEGTLFVPLPDGSAVLRALIGEAKEPSPLASLDWSLDLRSQVTMQLPIKNWMKKAVRFRVELSLAEAGQTLGPMSNPIGLTLTGPPSIDVPPLQERTYRLMARALREGALAGQVKFVVESGEGVTPPPTASPPAPARGTPALLRRSQQGALPPPAAEPPVPSGPPEYAFYRVAVKAVAPAPPAPIQLRTTVRRPMTETVMVENPMPDLATSMQVQCPQPAVTFRPATLDLPPGGHGSVELTFVPLDEMSEETNLTVTSKELGAIAYPLQCVGTPAPAEKSLRAYGGLVVEYHVAIVVTRTSLASSQTQMFRFVSRYPGGRLDYQCKVAGEAPDLTAFRVAQPTVSANPAPSASEGVEVGVPVIFEPGALGASRATLTVASPQGGTFTCVLVGHCVPPSPQGPLLVRATGAATTVTIRNPFAAPAPFNLAFDNGAFSAKAQETVPPKKGTPVTIAYKPPAPGVAATGRLTVTSPSAPQCAWVYYLKGLP
ncbi:putative Hydrocephalus-inducing protein [Paratrimastix pyriformis]|uniref:Hydrocephalus-inducing protein n=1 Tax=Paratrimastix pyriformis TaxID=342808 RepID=A0ABQ8UX09_9EUKA|nr:putative Hydrocephalus-inducing protein [Paratrimastix pyriformis]